MGCSARAIAVVGAMAAAVLSTGAALISSDSADARVLGLDAHGTGARHAATHHAPRVSHVRKAEPSPPYKCQVFPSDNALNQEIAAAPVSPNSANYVASIGLSAHLHPDFGTNATYGIPYTVVGPEQPKVPIKFTA